MVENFNDTWDDKDLADPALLATGKRFLGEITNAEYNVREFSKPMKDGRTAIPMVTLTVKARKGADGSDFTGQNVQLTTSTDFWFGKEDVIGRQSLARLAALVLGVEKSEFFGKPISETLTQLVGGKVSFEVNHREYTGSDGGQRKIQSATKLKAATAEEMTLMM